jgi:hypothetical protein
VTADVNETHAYSIKVSPKDPYYAENGFYNLTYYMSIMPNRVPVVDNSKKIGLQEHQAGSSFTITFDADSFSDPEGESITYSYNSSTDDLTSWLSFNPATRTFTGNPVPNGDVGNYTIYVIANDVNAASGEGSYSFTLNITQNLPPTVVTPAPDPSPACVKAYFAFAHAVAKSNYNEPEGEAMDFSFTVSDAGIGSWVTMAENTTHLNFGGTPNNTEVGNFTVTIEINDIYPAVAGATDDFDV